jgi:hypothetical protein
MVSFNTSNLLIWPSEAGKGDKMLYVCDKGKTITPVFGKVPEAGIFIYPALVRGFARRS